MNKKKDKWDICRTCGNIGNVEIFGRDGVALQLEEKINAYLPITVSVNDNLPLKLCTTCIYRLESCHELIVSAIEMNKTLEELIKKKYLQNNSYSFKNNEDVSVEEISLENAQNIEILEINSPDEEDESHIVTLNEDCQYEYETLDINDANTEELCEEILAVDQEELEIDEEVVGERIDALQCPKCQRVFDTESKMRRHIIIQHKLENKECFQCLANFDSLLHFEAHVATHYPQNKYLCDFCPTMFTHVSGLLDHLTKHKNDREKFTCKNCGKVLANRLSFSIHQRTHTGEKPHSCRFCDRTFSQISSKQYHERTHTGETTHHCEFCGKGFNSKLTRDTHRRIHTGERPFGCKQCNATFRCLANLRQHEMVHAPVKPFQCEICFKRFGRPEKVRVHMRTHTGEKPYKCPICERGFTQKNDMLKHTNIHNKQSRRNNTRVLKTNDSVNNNTRSKFINIKKLKELGYDVSNSYDSSEN